MQNRYSTTSSQRPIAPTTWVAKATTLKPTRVKLRTKRSSSPKETPKWAMEHKSSMMVPRECLEPSSQPKEHSRKVEIQLLITSLAQMARGQALLRTNSRASTKRASSARSLVPYLLQPRRHRLETFLSLTLAHRITKSTHLTRP